MKKLLFCSFFLLCCLSSHLSARQSQNLQLLGNYRGHRVQNAQGTYYSSVWGYYDASGREYGIIGTYEGTAIVDLSYLPDSLHEAAFIPGPRASYSYREMKTYLNYLYIVSEGGSGVQIVDLSGLPNSVRIVGSFTFPGYSQTHTVGETAGYLYLNGGDATPVGGTAIVSLADPEKPVKLGQFNAHYVHDTYVRRDTLFAAGIFGVGLSIIDVRDKANPVLLTTIKYDGAGTHNAWTTDDGRFLLTTDEIGATNTLKIWDIQNLNQISKVAEWNPRPQDIIHNVLVKGEYAYAAYYKAGLLIADVSSPSNPVEAAFYDTFPDSTRDLYNGAWGAYPFLPSGRILASDMTYGLFVFRFDRQRIGKLIGTITDAATGLPLDGAIIRNKETGQTRWTNAAGQYLWGYAVGTFTLTLEKQGYQSRTFAAAIVKDSTTILNLSLTRVATTIARDPASPVAFTLHQNYPNPFSAGGGSAFGGNPSTTLAFDLPYETRATVTIYDVYGRAIAVLVDGNLSHGRHQIECDGRNLSSGVYFYKLRTPEFSMARRMILVK